MASYFIIINDMKATSEIRLIMNQNVRQTEYKIFLKTFYA